MIKVAAYTRVSTDKQDQKNSNAAQISYYNNFIQGLGDGYSFVKIYSDGGVSGTATKNRDEFNEMMRDCEDGKIDLIYTKSISRFARNTVDLLRSVRHLKELNVEVRFEKENISSMSGDGELMLSLLAGFAQSESESISSNVIWGKRKRMEEGIDQFHNTFGFDFRDNQYLINEKEAKVVRLAFKLFLQGLSYTEIANEINKGNVRTRTGRHFNQLSVKDILRQEKYMGDSLLQKRYTVSPITHKVVRNKGEMKQYYLLGTHPAIVSKSDFEKAKERIEFIHDNQVKCHKQSSWHTGLVKCPICGRSMIKVNSKTLKCIGYTKHHTCENRATLKISELEEFVKNVDLSKVDKIIFNKIRTTKFSRKGYRPCELVPRNIDKGDFEIIWKKDQS